MELSEYELKSLRRLEEAVREDKWSKKGLVKLIKLIGEDYLNMMTIPRYAEAVHKSYPGVIKTKEVTELMGVRWIIEND